MPYYGIAHHNLSAHWIMDFNVGAEGASNDMAWGSDMRNGHGCDHPNSGVVADEVVQTLGRKVGMEMGNYYVPKNKTIIVQATTTTTTTTEEHEKRDILKLFLATTLCLVCFSHGLSRTCIVVHHLGGGPWGGPPG